MKIRHTQIAAALLAVLPITTLATEVPEIVVSATRTAQSADESLNAVTVIDREEIERRQPRDMLELLQGSTGLSVSRNGSYGRASNLYLRGTESNHVLVLVDGVRVASATLGTFAWENLSPEQIERIEIVRGPRASLYGSDAVGGVIQIFTRTSGGPFLRASTGSHNSNQLEVGYGGGDRWRYQVGAGHFDSDGLPSNVNASETDGYKNRHGNLSLEGPLGEATTLRLTANHAEGENHLDPDTGDIDFINQNASLRLDHARGNWLQSLTLGHARDESTSHSPYTPATITTRRNSASWQHDIDSRFGLTSVGIDHWQDHATKDESGEVDETITNTGLFVQQQWQWGESDFELGLRRDSSNSFDDHTTGHIGWGRDLDPTTRLVASYGTAFKAPSVNDLYWPYSASTYFGTTYITEGNPDLEPETSYTAEIGLRHTPSPALRLSLSIYHTEVDDMIDWQGVATGPTEFTYRPTNLNSATINGIELEGVMQIDTHWQAKANLTLLDAINDETDEQLDRRPTEQLSLQFSRITERDTLNLELLAVSDRNDVGATRELGGYTIANASWAQRMNSSVTLEFRVENISDQSYALASGFSGDYSTLGRTFHAGFSYRP